MYLLDTNHCSRLFDAHPGIVSHLKALGNVELATCVVVRGELRLMVERSERRAENDRKVRAFLRDVVVHPIDDAVADTYGELKAQLLGHFGPKSKTARRRSTIEGLGFKENDLWIAAVALRRNLVVVTSDSDFSRMKDAVPRIRLEDRLSGA